MAAVFDESRSFFHNGIEFGRRFGLEMDAKIGENLGIDAVSFGKQPFGFSVVTCERRVDARCRDSGVLKEAEKRFFIAAGGLKNDVWSDVFLSLVMSFEISALVLGMDLGSFSELK